MSANYRVVIAPTLSGLGSPASLELHPGDGLQFDWGLNRAGNCRVNAAKRSGREKVTRALLEPWRSSLWVERNGQMVWGGIITDIGSSSTGTSVSISAEEFWVFYESIILRRSLITPNYTLDIADGLIAYASSLEGGDIGVRTARVPANATGYTYAPLWREYEERDIPGMVTELQRVGMHTIGAGGQASSPDEGFEITQEIDTTSGVPQPVITWWAPRAGKDVGVPMEWGEGTNQTLFAVQSWSLSSKDMATHLRVKGIGQNSEQQRADVVYQQSIDDGYPRKMGVYAHSDVRTNQEAISVGVDRLARIGKPIVQVRASMLMDGPHLSWGDLHVGDRVGCHIVDHDIEVVAAGETLRVTSLGIEAKEGQETALFDLQPYIPHAEV